MPLVALNEMVANLVKFLLLKYPAKELTSQVEMLKKALRDNQEHFPVVFSQASQCLQLVCGMEVKKVEPREHIYIMVPILGLTCNAMLSSGQSIPKAGRLPCFVWKGFRTFPAHLRMRPVSRGSPRGNPACRGTFGGRRKAVRDRLALQGGTGDFP